MASTWTESFKPDPYPALESDIETDALIIGGGIAGTTAAYLLAKQGARVAMIDKGTLGESATAYTTAFITQAVDTGLAEMAGIFGPEKAASVWRSHADAIGMIERNIRDEGISCEFMRCSNYMYANDDTEWDKLMEEARQAKESGFDLEKKWDSRLKFRNRGYLVMKDQAKFHPIKYLDGLRKASAASGARICDGTEAKAISNDAPGINSVLTTGGTIRAKKILIATHNPFNRPAELFAHKGIYTTHIIELAIPAGKVPEGIYEDEENPYHYFRIDAGAASGGRDRMILGGEDHRHELPLDPGTASARLEEYFTSLLSGAEYEVVRYWNGPIIETADGLAFIGQYSESNPDLFLATGFSGNGMTYGTIAGEMFARFALDEDVPWTELYDPRRRLSGRAVWRKGRDYAEELARGYGRSIFGKSEHNKGGSGEGKRHR